MVLLFDVFLEAVAKTLEIVIFEAKTQKVRP